MNGTLLATTTLFTTDIEAVRRDIMKRDVKSVEYVFNWKAIFDWKLPFFGYLISI